MSTQIRYQSLINQKKQVLYGMISFLILELLVSTIYLRPENFSPEIYKVSGLMDGSIVLGLVMGIIFWFCPRSIQKKWSPLSVVPLFIWLFFYGFPYLFSMF